MKNKKLLIIIIASVLAVAIIATVVISIVLNNSKKDVYNNEEDPLIFSTLELEKVFNPFFSTAATDSNVVGMTQISMLSNTADGEEAFGKDEGVVALDFEQRSNGGTQDVDLQTTYYFVLKNNIRFSDGTPLTMKDVLFNLYVYLDPNYTGSATMYSTDIVGLKEYRTNALSEKEQDGFRDQFDIVASQRISDLSYAAQRILDANPGGITKEKMREELAKDSNANLVKDYDEALEFFREELESDFANSINTYEDTKFKKEGETTTVAPFTTDVEVFFYNEGYITWNKKDGKLEDVITQNNNTAELKGWTKEEAINYVFEDKIPGKIVEIINYWATSTTLHSYISNAAMEDYFLNLDDNEQVRSISGIKFANRTEAVTVNGTTYPAIGENYNADGSVKEGFNEVLSITINNLDPKAKWNFAFTVAPLHYYSNQEQIAKFDYENHFGVEKGSQTFMEKVIKGADKIGLPLGAGPYAPSKASGGINTKENPNHVTATDFYDANNVYFESNPYYVLGQPKIKKLRFHVVSSNGMLNTLYTNVVDFAEPSAKPELIDEIEDKGFESKSIRTSGYGYIGVNAGKVPSINVRQAIMHAINTQLCVEYYKNTASAIYRPISTTSWAYPHDATPYYPYIGGPIPKNVDKLNEDQINPAYQRYIAYIRENNIQTYADTKGTKLYTGSGDEYLSEEHQIQFIRWLVEENEEIVDLDHATSYNYVLNADGIYTTNIGPMNTRTLKFTFTVAGEETDHPAWSAMTTAEHLLDKCGFAVTTRTDARALSRLATGDLTVWAAAWGSTIDPDMYQVYHRDSAATSTLNWGYREIKNDPTRYAYESEIIDRLSEKIDLGREKLENDERKPIYYEALDLVMKLAVELPTYQRDDLFAYNQNKIDQSSLNQSPTAYKGLTSDIHTVSLVTER